MSKVIALYHVVFCTKSRMHSIPESQLNELYRYIWRLIEDRECKLLRIGGITNHVHMLIDLHPNHALADLMRDIKSLTSNWMKSDLKFPLFHGWGEGYYAVTLSPEDKAQLIEYIINQKRHHLNRDEDTEFASMFFLYDKRDMQ